jgi:hypothetical protein
MIFEACRAGDVEAVRRMLKAGADKEKASTNGSTPIYTACFNGHIEVVQLLVEAGADMEKASSNGCTPLYVACQKGNIEVARLLVEAGADKEKASTNGFTPLHLAAMHGHDTICMLLTFKGADLTACSSYNHTPAEAALLQGHASLAAHLHISNGAHYLRCMGPSLERRLLWNDTNQQHQETMLDEMQAQWLARVAEGCGHAHVGLALRGAFSGGLSTCMLLHVMGYVFEGTQAHLQSCISTGRTTAAAVAPKLALVSHALALAVTPSPQLQVLVLGVEARQRLQAVLAGLVAATEAAEGGCEWLHAYCDFLQRRHRLGS